MRHSPFCQISVGELTTDVSTSNPEAMPDTTFTYVDIASVDQEGKRIVGAREVPGRDAPSRARQKVRAGDVLVSTVRPNLNAVALVPRELDGAIASTGFCVLRPNPARFDNSYLFHWVRTQNFIIDMTRRATGASYPAVSDRIIKSSSIPLPYPSDPAKSLAEQRRIAEILDKADSIRRKRKDMISLNASTVTSLFLDYFGDPSTNKHGFPVGTIRDLASDVQYGTSKKAGSAGKFPILRMNNLTTSGEWRLADMKYIDLEPREIDKCTVRKGDLLFNRTNSPELVGKTAVYRENEAVAFAGYLIRLRTAERSTTEYISAFLNSAYGKTILRGMCKHIIGMANINATELCKIPILIPPLETRQAFLGALEELRSLNAKLITLEGQSDILFQSLVQRAFRGQL